MRATRVVKLESDVEGPAVEWAVRHGILHRKLNGDGNRGWPDQIFFFAGGQPLLIEFKRPGKRPRALQVYVMQQLKDRGYDVRWTDKKEEAIRWLKQRLAAAARLAATP